MFHLLVLVVLLSACMADEVGQPTASPQILIHNDYHRVESHRLRQGLERLRHDLNIPSSPHQHLNDPYRQSYIDLGNRNVYDNRRDQYDDRRNDKGRGHDDWQDYREKYEKQWWTDKDTIEHVNDDEDIKGPVILRTIKSHEDHHRPDIARQNKIIADVYSPDYAQPTWIVDYRYLKTGGRDYTRGPGGQIIILPKGIRTNEHKEFKDYDELIEHLRQQNLAERRKPQYFMPLGQEINQQREDHKRDDDRRWYN